MTDSGKKSFDISEILSRAAELIEPEGAWIKADFARTAYGEEVDPSSPDAVCWCARGAIAAASRTADPADIKRIWTNAAAALGFDSYLEIEGWNDDKQRTQAEVVYALRKAAAAKDTGETQ